MYKEAIPTINNWCKKMGLSKVSVDVKKQRGFYDLKCGGCCYYWDNKIELNPYYATLPTICLEKLIVHELCHFFVHSHGLKFYRTMDKFFPDWRRGMFSYEYLEKGDPYDKWPDAEYIIVIGPY